MRPIIGAACVLALVACGRSPPDVGGASSSGGHGGAAVTDSGALGGGSGTAGASDAGGGASLKQIGQTCAEGIDCESSFCANGVCCAMFCGGDCWSCAVPGSVGSCEPVPTTSPCGSAECDGNNLMPASRCDGQGTCRPSPLVTCVPFMCDAQAAACRTTCATDIDCFDIAGAYCSGDEVCAARKPGGASCTLDHECISMECLNQGDGGPSVCATCTTDADCSGAMCINGSCSQTLVGASCTSNDECASGFCADGVCCNVACEGGCVSCAQAGRIGTCLPVDVGTLDPRGVCRDQGASSCGTTGTCDGFGACASYADGTICAGATCAGATLTLPRICDGLGTCLATRSVSCAPLTCRADIAQCVGDNCPDGDAICAPGAYCSGNEVCAPRKQAGAPCDSDHECANAICLRGLDGGPTVCASLN